MSIASNPSPRLLEAILEELGTDVPDDELPVLGLARRRFLRGERLTPKDWAAETGHHPSMLSTAKAQLSAVGYQFEVERIPIEGGIGPPRQVSWIVNRDHVPTLPEPAPGKALAEVEATPPSTPRAKKKSAPEPQHGLALDPSLLPGFGQSLTVYALVLNRDNSISVGLRNGTRQWTANITGMMEDVDS
jgi:hypothetical protein